MIFTKVVAEVLFPIAIITIALNTTIAIFEKTASLALSLFFLNGSLLLLGVYQLLLIRLESKSDNK